MDELTTQPWFLWGLGLVVAFPALVLFLGQLYSVLRRQNMALGNVVKLLRNLLLPLIVLFLFVIFVMEQDPTEVLVRILFTLVLIGGLYILLSFVNAVIFGAAPEGSWRSRTPRLLRDLIRVFLVAIGAAIVLANVWDQDLAGLITALGVGSIVIGLALQETLGNVMSGIALLIERPLSEGDWIEIGGHEGRVLELNWRAVRILNRAQDVVIVPHTTIAKDTFINHSLPKPPDMTLVPLGFGYEHPPNLIKDVLMEVALKTEGVLESPAPRIETTSYDDSCITYTVKYYIGDPEKRPLIRDRFMTLVWYAAQRHRLNIPFPIRTLYTFDGQATQSNETQQALHGMSASALLRDILQADQLDQWAQGARLMHFGEKEVILEQGALGENLYLIVSGEAEVWLTRHGQRHHLYDLRHGEFFGEFSLLTGGASPYSIIADNDLQLLVMSSEMLHQLIDKRPSLAMEIGKIMDARRQMVKNLSL